MRKQKAAYEDLNNAKMDASAFDANTVALPEPPPAPDLPDSGDIPAPASSLLSLDGDAQAPSDIPDSDDLDPTSLMMLSAERVRLSTQVVLTMHHGLKSWGGA